MSGIDSGRCSDAHPVAEAEAGCLSLDCALCARAIGKALRELGTLLDSFYNALALYPSSKALIADHPLVGGPHFQNRIKVGVLSRQYAD